MNALAFALLLLLAAGCATAPSAGVPLTGKWGGEHIGLELTPTGGTLDYDCATGRIDGPVLPGANGTFQAVGTLPPAPADRTVSASSRRALPRATTARSAATA